MPLSPRRPRRERVKGSGLQIVITCPTTVGSSEAGRAANIRLRSAPPMYRLSRRRRVFRRSSRCSGITRRYASQSFYTRRPSNGVLLRTVTGVTATLHRASRRRRLRSRRRAPAEWVTFSASSGTARRGNVSNDTSPQRGAAPDRRVERQSSWRWKVKATFQHLSPSPQAASLETDRFSGVCSAAPRRFQAATGGSGAMPHLGVTA